MKNLVNLCLGISWLGTAVLAKPLAVSLHQTLLRKRADDSKVGYLAVYWEASETGVFFALSSNDDPFNFVDLNNGNPMFIPTVGGKVVRDVSIVPGGGSEEGQKWYIIGTDLNRATTTWDEAVRNGSRGIMTWESTDLLTWTDERLIEVEGDTAGMVWAPDAIWIPEKEQYFAYWSSSFYDESDTAHSGDATPLYIRAALTSDFTTYGSPYTYIDYSPSDTLDMALLEVDDDTYIRFIVGGGVEGPVAEVSTSGLWGSWDRPAGSIGAGYEAPYAFWDNSVSGRALLMCDRRGGSTGLRQWTSDDPTSGVFTADTSADNTRMRHGSVMPVSQEQYDALSALL